MPVVYFLFTNLMNSGPGAGERDRRLRDSLPLMGKVLFLTFLVSIPGILDLVVRKGSRRNSR